MITCWSGVFYPILGYVLAMKYQKVRFVKKVGGFVIYFWSE